MTLTIPGDPAQRPPLVFFFDTNVLVSGTSWARPIWRTRRVRLSKADYYRFLAFMAGDE